MYRPEASRKGIAWWRRRSRDGRVRARVMTRSTQQAKRRLTFCKLAIVDADLDGARGARRRRVRLRNVLREAPSHL
jgi:hypothetical protein